MIPRVHISSPKPQRAIELPDDASYLHVDIVGYDNTLCVRSSAFQADISIFGCNNTIIIEPDCISRSRSSICIGDRETPCFGCTIRIGRGCIFTAVDMRLFDRNGEICIGEDCLFSWDIMMWGSDTHALFDAEGQLRRGRRIHIGHHVWVGHGCHIGKNTYIADGCVIGWGSVVSGRFEEPNCVVAGSPARVVRRGVQWNRKRPDDFIAERAADLQQYADWADELPRPVPTRRQTLRALAKIVILRCLASLPGAKQAQRRVNLTRAKAELARILDEN